MNYTPSLADKFKDVNQRLIQAFGLDTSNDNVRVEWPHFLGLKCFLELFTLGTEELEDIWLKALDPRGLALVNYDEFFTFMERIARGSLSEEPTEVSKQFAYLIMKLLQLEDCYTHTINIDEGEKADVDCMKLKQRIKVDKTIDVDIFNQLLKQDCLYKVKSTNYDLDEEIN